MANANESFRQDVHEKSPNELFGGDRHQALFVTVGVISPAERDVIAVECNQPVIRDRDAVRVASEIAHHLLGSAECRLGVNHPIVPEQCPQECRKGFRFAKTLDLSSEDQAFAAKSPAQSVDELSTEDLSEDFHR